MPTRDGWKTLKPEEQMVDLVRMVQRMERQLALYTRLQGIRLESRLSGGNRQLWAVVDDPGAANDGASYQLAP